jgi:hypothetical protein
MRFNSFKHAIIRGASSPGSMTTQGRGPGSSLSGGKAEGEYIQQLVCMPPTQRHSRILSFIGGILP